LSFRLRDDLVDELARRTEEDHPLGILSATPLSDQQANKRLPAASRQLQRNVTRILCLGNIPLHHLPLM
jgi:hypothetical protein